MNKTVAGIGKGPYREADAAASPPKAPAKPPVKAPVKAKKPYVSPQQRMNKTVAGIGKGPYMEDVRRAKPPVKAPVKAKKPYVSPQQRMNKTVAGIGKGPYMEDVRRAKPPVKAPVKAKKRPSGSSRPSSAPPKGEDFEQEFNVGKRRPRLNSPPAPKSAPKSANPSGKKDPYPDGIFRKLFSNAEIEYDYPSDDDQAVDMKKGGRVKKAASKGKRGSVSAEEFKDSYANWQNNKDKLATEKSPRKKPVKKNMGGMMKYANGGKVRGHGMARGGRPCKMVSMKGS
tara:strand:- start:1516 stop:2370 length:855 start_codon:yes stop_codon:yes gene_type:complete